MTLTAQEKGKGRASSPLVEQPSEIWEQARQHSDVISILVGSATSTMLGYPLDTLKNRMQTSGAASRPKIHNVISEVFREEGVRGFYRGCLIPVASISVTRELSFCSVRWKEVQQLDRILFGMICLLGFFSISIYSGISSLFPSPSLVPSSLSSSSSSPPTQNLNTLALTSFLSGLASGTAISVTSTPFELVKIRRQLEVAIAKDAGHPPGRDLGTMGSIREIMRTKKGSWTSLYTGFGPHLVRDGFGTGLYFAFNETSRAKLGRLPSGEQGPVPTWFPIPMALIPFFCGAASGVLSWAMVYPIDAVKTNMQKRSLASQPYRGPIMTLRDLTKGRDPLRPQPLTTGILRLYSGLGVSALRSTVTHGLLWLIIDNVQSYLNDGKLSASKRIH